VTQLDGLANDFSVMPLSPAGFDEWKSIASAQNAEIAAARFALEAAEQEVNKSRAGHMPRLDLNASYSRSKSDSLINLDRDATVRSIGVQLVVPLYSGGYVDALTSQALANRDKAQADLDATTNKVMIELHRQYSATQNSLAKINALQKSVNSATLLVQATQQSVKGGQRINLDVLNAQQQQVSAQLDLTQARYGYLIGLLKLRMAAGTLNPDDLRAVAAQLSSSD
jgi:protease secretion system outer membrane protein